MTLESVFRPLIGQLVWSVRKGHGTFLTMEFGAPHLDVVGRRKPMQMLRRKPGVILHGARCIYAATGISGYSIVTGRSRLSLQGHKP
ncbi:MAG: hypothetical protein CTR53_01420 [Ferrovibrio sp.]|nr:MAG: hypothetical protein CTR53_01420 [Ferrovibrio sp.]